MLIALLLCSVASGDFHVPVARPGAAETGAVHPTRLLVQPARGADPAALELLHRRLGAHVLRELPQIRWQIVEVEAARLAEVRGQYAESALIEHAEFDHARHLPYTP